jgi:hypothetical protein
MGKKRKGLNIDNYLVTDKKIGISTSRLKSRYGLVGTVRDTYFEFKEIINYSDVINDKVAPEFNYHQIDKDEIEDIYFI